MFFSGHQEIPSVEYQLDVAEAVRDATGDESPRTLFYVEERHGEFSVETAPMLLSEHPRSYYEEKLRHAKNFSRTFSFALPET